MRFLDERKEGFPEELAALLKRPAPDRDPSVVKSVTDIIERVFEEGDEALFDYSRKFDKIEIDENNVEVKQAEIEKAVATVPQEMMQILKRAHDRVSAFHKSQIDNGKYVSYEYKDELGIKLGMIVAPLDTVGVYVPGGKAAYPSSVLMGAIPAKLAGVRHIIMVSPQRDAEFHPYLLAAARLAGVDRIFRVGGAQAIAAMAYGTKSIPRVDKIVGPGNAYVACAKRMLYGTVDIDMVAGPSEVLIISDGSANPAFIAADLLSQAEHDETARSIFITTSEWEAKAVNEEINCQLEVLDRANIARESIENNGAIILVDNMDRAAELANSIAPEHLELVCKKSRKLIEKIKNAGAIFIGSLTTEPLGDYMLGPNHILPTGGSARFRGPLGVYDFYRRSSVMEVSKQAFLSLADDVAKFAGAEQLTAHANAVHLRLAKEKPNNGK